MHARLPDPAVGAPGQSVSAGPPYTSGMELRPRLPLAPLLAVALGACVASAPAPSPTPAVLTDTVAIFEPPGRPAEWGYTPAAIRVASGTTVSWMNPGAEFHTITSDDPGRTFDAGILPGQRVSVAFTRTGTYAYHCGVHPQMRAVVIVCDGPCR